MPGKARVHELAKELGIDSKTVLAKLKEQGEFVKSASSTVEAPVARRLREAYGAHKFGKACLMARRLVEAGASFVEVFHRGWDDHEGAGKRVRPMLMTVMTAIFGLLPAAFSTRIGAQTQRPLAIVVVGGMIASLLLTRYLMPVLYSFYGHREPPAGSGSMAH